MPVFACGGLMSVRFILVLLFSKAIQARFHHQSQDWWFFLLKTLLNSKVILRLYIHGVLQEFFKNSSRSGDYDGNKSSHNTHGNKAGRIVTFVMKYPYVQCCHYN